MQKALATAWHETEKYVTPTYLVQAGKDALVDPDASRAWLAQTGTVDAYCKFLPEHYHEVLNEPDWEQTLGEIFQWLNQRMPSQSDAEELSVAC